MASRPFDRKPGFAKPAGKPGLKKGGARPGAAEAPKETITLPVAAESERIAKVLARSGVASRRDAERMIAEGLISVNGKVIDSPALDVTRRDRILVDGVPLAPPEPPRLWLYHKPAGLVTTERDELGRPTVFENLPEGLPRVMSVGRLDLSSEGLLLLTNDGELKRKLELPATGWLRKYRVRINGRPVDQEFAPLREGITIDGELFQPMLVGMDRQQGANAWLTVGIREGRNREVRRAMEAIGYTVNRLIRVSYGPFQLGDLRIGEVSEVRPRTLRDQLGLTEIPDVAPTAGIARVSGTSGRSTIAAERTSGSPARARVLAAGRGARDESERPAPRPRDDAAPRGPRPSRGGFGRSAREEGDRPSFRSRDDAAPRGNGPTRGGFAARPAREDGDRPSFRSRDDAAPRGNGPSRGGFAARPAREDGDRPSFRSRDDAAPRSNGPSRGGFAARPAREDGDRPSFRSRDDAAPRGNGPSRGGFAARPARAEGDRPSFRSRDDAAPRGNGPSRGGFAARPARAEGDRPSFRSRDDAAPRGNGPSRGGFAARPARDDAGPRGAGPRGPKPPMGRGPKPGPKGPRGRS